jgi:amino acid transporter
VVIIVSLLPFLTGWRSWIRMQAIVFAVTMVGLLFSTIVAIFTSESSFRSSFNDFARSITGKQDTYGAVITTAQKAGVVTDPAFSFSKTLPMVAFVAAFGIYSYFTSFVGGELRQGSSTKTAHRMALGGVLSIASVAIIALIFFHSFGHSFLVSAYGGGMPKEISVTPTYFFLTSAQLGNVAVAVFLVVSFALFWPLLTAIAFLQPTRMLFAYSFDGLLPSFVAKVSGRSQAPVVAVAISGVLSIATLYWAIYLASNVFQVVTYIVLAQVVAMGLVGLAALVFPYRRPELYRASTTTKTFLGIPVVSIAGAGAIISTVILWVLYFTEAKLGLSDKRNFFLWIGGTGVLAVIFYYGARFVRRREGIDLDRVYGEIPPE